MDAEKLIEEAARVSATRKWPKYLADLLDSLSAALRETTAREQATIASLRCAEGSLKEYAAANLAANQEIVRLNAECEQHRAELARLTTPSGEPLDMDCGDNSCLFAAQKGGMRTNGGCRCLEGLGFRRGPHDALRKMAAEIVAMRKRLSEITTPRPIAEAPKDGRTQIIALWMDGDVVEAMDVVIWADMDDGDHPERKFWMNMAGDSVEDMTHFLPLPVLP